MDEACGALAGDIVYEMLTTFPQHLMAPFLTEVGSVCVFDVCLWCMSLVCMCVFSVRHLGGLCACVCV